MGRLRPWYLGLRLAAVRQRRAQGAASDVLADPSAW
jgi:hypothetical protein